MRSNTERRIQSSARQLRRVQPLPGDLMMFKRRSLPVRGGHPARRGRRFHLLLWLLAIVASIAAVLFLLSGKRADPLAISTEVAVAGTTLSPTSVLSSGATLVHSVQGGDNWQSIADQYGLSRSTGGQFARAIELLPPKEQELAQLKRGQDLELTLVRGTLARARLIIDPSKSIVLEPDISNTFSARVVVRVQEMKERVLLGVISPSAPSFSRAATEAGVSYDTVDDLVDLFADRINFRRDFRMGDRFTVIYRERVLDDETVVAPGPILAAIVSVGGKRYVAVRFVGSDGVARYFDEVGKPIESGFLRYPLKFSKITSEFTYARFHPVLKVKRPHNGVDFAAPVGAPVRTVADGVIVFAGWKNGGGNTVNVRHGDRYETEYMHLSKITPGIKKGTRVRRGELIGAVGSTGLATGPHLHFGFKDNGKYVNPLKIDLPTVETLAEGQNINSRYLKRVLFTLRRYQGIDREILSDGANSF